MDRSEDGFEIILNGGEAMPGSLSPLHHLSEVEKDVNHPMPKLTPVVDLIATDNYSRYPPSSQPPVLRAHPQIKLPPEKYSHLSSIGSSTRASSLKVACMKLTVAEMQDPGSRLNGDNNVAYHDDSATDCYIDDSSSHSSESNMSTVQESIIKESQMREVNGLKTQFSDDVGRQQQNLDFYPKSCTVTPLKIKRKSVIHGRVSASVKRNLEETTRHAMQVIKTKENYKLEFYNKAKSAKSKYTYISNMVKKHSRLGELKRKARLDHCPKCDYAGPPNSLANHMKCHGRSEAHKYLCYLCDYSHMYRNLIDHHLEHHHVNKSCRFCGHVFTRIHLKERHERMHGAKNKFTCLLCQFSCNAPLSIENHRRLIHLNHYDVRGPLSQDRFIRIDARVPKSRVKLPCATDVDNDRINPPLLDKPSSNVDLTRPDLQSSNVNQTFSSADESGDGYILKKKLKLLGNTSHQQSAKGTSQTWEVVTDKRGNEETASCTSKYNWSWNKSTDTYQCKLCPYKTSFINGKSIISRHVYKHFTKSRYSCQICNYSCKSMKYALNHASLHPNLDKVFLKDGVEISLKHEMLPKKRGRPRLIKKPNPVPNVSSGVEGSEDNLLTQFVCPSCPFSSRMVTPRRAKFIEKMHSQCHNGKGRLKCLTCDFATNSYGVLKHHTMHHTEKEFNSAENHSGDRQLIQDHISDNAVGRQVTDLLEKDASSDGHVVNNLPKEEISGVRHTASCSSTSLEEYPERQCPFCTFSIFKDDTSAGLQAMEQHVGYHIKKARYTCHFCSYSHQSSSEVTQHQLLHHPDAREDTTGMKGSREGLYRCKYCQFSSKLPRVTAMHEKRHSDIGDQGSGPLTGVQRNEESFECSKCSYFTTDEQFFEIHVAGHEVLEKKKMVLSPQTEQIAINASKLEVASGNFNKNNDDGISKNVLNNSPSVRISAIPSKKRRMLEIPANLWFNSKSSLYECSWCDYNTKTERFFKVHLYCHQRKVAKFRCAKCGYGTNNSKHFAKHTERLHMLKTLEGCENSKPRDLIKAVEDIMNGQGKNQDLAYNTMIGVRLAKDINAVNSNDGRRLAMGLPPNTNTMESLSKKPASPSIIVDKRHIIAPLHIKHVQKHLCSLCPYKSSSPASLLSHFKGHRRNHKHSCQYCSYSARTKQDLEIHCKVHFALVLPFVKNVMQLVSIHRNKKISKKPAGQDVVTKDKDSCANATCGKRMEPSNNSGIENGLDSELYCSGPEENTCVKVSDVMNQRSNKAKDSGSILTMANRQPTNTISKLYPTISSSLENGTTSPLVSARDSTVSKNPPTCQYCDLKMKTNELEEHEAKHLQFI